MPQGGKYFTETTKISICATTTAGAAGTTAITGSSVDMSGFDGVLFVFAFGAIVAGAATSIKLQDSSDNSSFNDIAGTNQTIADTDDDKVFYSDLSRPTKRYVRPVVSRATQNATVGSVLAMQYRSRKAPVAQGANVAGEQFTDPIDGTA
jgi:hypothetical protein